MDVNTYANITADRSAIFDAIADLATYPEWLQIVASADRVAPHDGDVGDAWSVVLVGRLGPLRKTKRVRMVRTVCDRETGAVRFERVERNGREHNTWVLTATATNGDGPGASRLAVHLHYSGGWLPPGADRLLGLEASRAGGRLERLLRSG
jgi:hypothetical protein